MICWVAKSLNQSSFWAESTSFRREHFWYTNTQLNLNFFFLRIIEKLKNNYYEWSNFGFLNTVLKVPILWEPLFPKHFFWMTPSQIRYWFDILSIVACWSFITFFLLEILENWVCQRISWYEKGNRAGRRWCRHSAKSFLLTNQQI